MANCVRRHHSVARRLTNALATVVFDGDGAPECRHRSHMPTPPLSRHSFGSLAAAACFDGGRCRSSFARCFDPGCQSPVSSHRKQLAWVEPLGVHKELKDMDPCQRISYIAHILQVQLRIRDWGPLPHAAHPTICPPGARGSVT